MKQGCKINGVLLRHKWSDLERIDIAILLRFYENPLDQLLRIWSFVHRNKLATEGYPRSGYPLQAMRAQVTWMKAGGVGTAAWNRVTSLSLSDARQLHASRKDTMEEAAQRLRIVLRLRLSTTSRETQPTKSPNAAKRNSIAPARADEWDSSSSDENDKDGASPCYQRQQRLTASHIHTFTFDVSQISSLPQNRVNVDEHDTNIAAGRPSERPLLQTRDPTSPQSPRQPLLLFRAFLAGHGFKARRFLASNKMLLPPPPMASKAFLEQVDPHLREYLPQNAQYLSPFISLTESPRRALDFIGKKNLPRSFAIFETNAITRDGRQRYEDQHMPYPWLVPSICHKHGLDDLPQGYTGTGEFLVWGSIEAQPIATLTNSEALQLLRVMESMGKDDAVGEATGEKLGPCLSSIPDKWKEAIAYKLIRSYKVKGYLRGAQGLDYDEFINSVYSTNRGNRAASVFEYHELPQSRTRIVVEVPVIRKSKEETSEGTSGINWEIVEDNVAGRQISIAVPEQDLIMGESSDHIQDWVDAQLSSDRLGHGPQINPASPAEQFLRELQEHATLPESLPVPPSDYSSSPVDTSAEDTVIIDLCDEVSDEEDDGPREVPQVDLTGNEQTGTDEDYEIIASATHGRGGHRALSIRSRSLSTILSTPTRVEKRCRERPKKVQTR